MSAFETWLSGKLQELETDEGVFLPYIVSILESEDETEEEKREGLTGILADCLDSEEEIEAVLNDIIDNWKNLSSKGGSVAEVVEEVKKLDITAKMHEITQERLANSKVKTKEMTEEEKKIKEAVLNSMKNGAKCDDEGEDEEAGDLGPANTNAAQVQQVTFSIFSVLTLIDNFSFQDALELKAKDAAAAAAKKEKDKQDRLNQKNKGEERKKKAQEKAAKGERKTGR